MSYCLFLSLSGSVSIGGWWVIQQVCQLTITRWETECIEKVKLTDLHIKTRIRLSVHVLFASRALNSCLSSIGNYMHGEPITVIFTSKSISSFFETFDILSRRKSKRSYLFIWKGRFRCIRVLERNGCMHKILITIYFKDKYF